MSRLPYPSLDDLPQEAAAALAAFPTPINIVRMTGHAPSLLAPLLNLSIAVMTSLALTDRHREMLLLLTAHETGCQYEWTQHLPQAAAAGLSPGDIALIRDSTRQSPDPAERALLSTGRRYLTAGETSHLVQVLQAHFTDEEIVEILYLLGYMRMFCLVVNALDLEVDPAGITIANGFAQLRDAQAAGRRQ
ncbi:carboxymuconolactone decarboxylase family protein [Streptomyces sp. b94]|nr:carboxymuconolactone decarboxylase family protein [Streptomyces sp. b94]